MTEVRGWISSGVPVKDVADRLKVSINAVYQLRRHYSNPRKRPSIWSPEKVERVVDLLCDGLTTREVADRFGVTKNSIIGLSHRWALRRPDAPSLDDRLMWSRVVQTGCRWIEGDLDGDWRWCGLPITRGDYCVTHHVTSRIKPKE